MLDYSGAVICALSPRLHTINNFIKKGFLWISYLMRLKAVHLPGPPTYNKSTGLRPI
ncbi:hypothetical protein PANT111_460024 [Pantoea brenneri]|uniref:Uncharacterized protein n=1 Tax=Pantoea brenneri TaxID=472694 RepID=A0AAX3JBG2_9GAMM|nr:hypothetical protein PANT111_460024 [Pantoea brenneri]